MTRDPDPVIIGRPSDLALSDQLLSPTWQRVIEPGNFTVFVGGSSATTQSAQFSVTNAAQLSGPGSAIPRFLREPAK